MRNLRWLLGLSILLFALSLAACGGTEEPSSVSSATDTGSLAETSAAPTEVLFTAGDVETLRQVLPSYTPAQAPIGLLSLSAQLPPYANAQNIDKSAR